MRRGYLILTKNISEVQEKRCESDMFNMDTLKMKAPAISTDAFAVHWVIS
jgi:hypothetical protein